MMEEQSLKEKYYYCDWEYYIPAMVWVDLLLQIAQGW